MDTAYAPSLFANHGAGTGRGAHLEILPETGANCPEFGAHGHVDQVHGVEPLHGSASGLPLHGSALGLPLHVPSRGEPSPDLHMHADEPAKPAPASSAPALPMRADAPDLHMHADAPASPDARMQTPPSSPTAPSPATTSAAPSPATTTAGSASSPATISSSTAQPAPVPVVPAGPVTRLRRGIQ